MSMLEQFLDEYLDAAGIRDCGKTPLFRSTLGRTGILTNRPMHRIDAYQMVRRRTAEAGLKGKLGCHVFRATGITAYLEAEGTLENAQAMAAHESPRPSNVKPSQRKAIHHIASLAYVVSKPTARNRREFWLNVAHTKRRAVLAIWMTTLEYEPPPIFVAPSVARISRPSTSSRGLGGSKPV